MTSRYDRDNKGAIKRSIIVFFVIFSILNYSVGENIKPYIVNSFSFIVSKISPLHSVLASWHTNFSNKETLVLSAESLQDQNLKLQNEISNLKLFIENSTLTEKFIENGETDIVKANRITPKIDIIYNNILLNKGFTSNVKEGNLVFVAGLLPVGKIKEVFSDSSNLELFSAQNNKLECYVHIDKESVSTSTQIENNTLNIEVYADGAYNFVAEVPDSINLKLEDKIYLREFSNYFIGKVYSIEHNDNEKMNRIFIKSNLDSSKNYDFYIKK